MTLLASSHAEAPQARAFRDELYPGAPVRLFLDPTGAINRHLGMSYHPQYRWLDRASRPVGKVFTRLDEAARAAPRGP